MTIEQAIESYKFGFNIICDGDSHDFSYGTNCNHCGKYFTSRKLDVYCKLCKLKGRNLYVGKKIS